MTLEKNEKSVMKVFKVSIWLNDEAYPETGWMVAKSALDVAQGIKAQSTVLLISTYRELLEAGYNVNVVQCIDGYPSEKIRKYHVGEYEVIK